VAIRQPVQPGGYTEIGLGGHTDRPSGHTEERSGLGGHTTDRPSGHTEERSGLGGQTTESGQVAIQKRDQAKWPYNRSGLGGHTSRIRPGGHTTDRPRWPYIQNQARWPYNRSA